MVPTELTEQQVLQVLQEDHKDHVVHRDLKAQLVQLG